MFKHSTALGGLLLAIFTCAAAVAVAESTNAPVVSDPRTGPATPQAVSPPTPEIVAAFPMLSSDPGGAADASARQSMQNQLGSTSDLDHGPIGTADFDMARSSAITGSSTRAWLVPSGNKACVVLPDPVDGYGVSCGSLEDIAAGHGFVALGPAAGTRDQTAMIAVLVPQGGPAPVVRNADGSATPLRVDGNIAAAVVPIGTGGALETAGHESVPLASFRPPCNM